MNFSLQYAPVRSFKERRITYHLHVRCDPRTWTGRSDRWVPDPAHCRDCRSVDMEPLDDLWFFKVSLDHEHSWNSGGCHRLRGWWYWCFVEVHSGWTLHDFYWHRICRSVQASVLKRSQFELYMTEEANFKVFHQTETSIQVEFHASISPRMS